MLSMKWCLRASGKPRKSANLSPALRGMRRAIPGHPLGLNLHSYRGPARRFRRVRDDTVSVMELPRYPNTRFLDYADRFTIRSARNDRLSGSGDPAIFRKSAKSKMWMAWEPQKQENPSRRLEGCASGREAELAAADVCGLKALRAFQQVKLYRLALIEGAITVFLDGGEMDEHVFAG